jgi:hypothetical protein
MRELDRCQQIKEHGFPALGQREFPRGGPAGFSVFDGQRSSIAPGAILIIFGGEFHPAPESREAGTGGSMVRPTLFRRLRNLLLPAFVLMPIPASSAPALGLGLIDGMNFSYAHVENHASSTGRWGWSMGGRAEAGLTSLYSLVVECMYVQKGARFDVLGITTRADFDYLEIPVLAKVKLGPPAFHGLFMAGPSFGFNVNTKGSFSAFSTDFDRQAAPVVYSMDFAGGAEIRLTRNLYLNSDARLSFGINNALDESVGDIDNWRSRDFRVLVGVTYQVLH